MSVSLSVIQSHADNAWKFRDYKEENLHLPEIGKKERMKHHKIKVSWTLPMPRALPIKIIFHFSLACLLIESTNCISRGINYFMLTGRPTAGYGRDLGSHGDMTLTRRSDFCWLLVERKRKERVKINKNLGLVIDLK